ncbi:unnamed protein product [Clonostachys byssicola]|uniref:Amidohydrolase-related domain-containing protein n=1 Tax=Clonostachys byssicola TaxID=160290 RepID=A0A9N9UMB5_9HYPO|nr:unnamed protein product [Clonostachys byssicola]
MVSFREVLFAQASLLQGALACGFHAGLSPTENPLLRRSEVPELPTKKILIQNVQVFDGHVILPPRDIVIDGSIIGNDSTDPDEIIDGHHGFLIPGLIDSHTHVQQISHMEDLSRYGVTTAFNMNCMNFTKCEIFKSQVGLTSIFTAGVPIIAPNSDHARTTPISESMLITDVSQADLYVGWAVANGSDFMKIVSEENGPTQEMQDAAVQASHSRDIQSSTHASWGIPYQQAIQSKTDSIHHIFGESLLAKKWLLRMKAQAQFSVPTLTVMRYVSENPIAREFLHGTVETNQTYPIYRENVKRLHQARVPVVAGTDAVGYVEGLFDMPHGVKLHEELENLVEAGMTEIEALRAATSLPAELQNLSDRGVIAPGRRADLILLNSDPFVNISNTKDINRVWIQGIEYPDVAKLA